MCRECLPPLQGQAAAECPNCFSIYATPHFDTNVDGYTICILVCNRCGTVLP